MSAKSLAPIALGIGALYLFSTKGSPFARHEAAVVGVVPLVDRSAEAVHGRAAEPLDDELLPDHIVVRFAFRTVLQRRRRVLRPEVDDGRSAGPGHEVFSVTPVHLEVQVAGSAGRLLEVQAHLPVLQHRVLPVVPRRELAERRPLPARVPAELAVAELLHNVVLLVLRERVLRAPVLAGDGRQVPGRVAAGAQQGHGAAQRPGGQGTTPYLSLPC